VRVGPERVDPPRRNPRRRGSTSGGDQGPTIRLVARAGEFISVVRLRASKPEAVGKPTCPQRPNGREGRDLKGSGITGMILETE
jgi:hypothetical protein